MPAHTVPQAPLVVTFSRADALAYRRIAGDGGHALELALEFLGNYTELASGDRLEIHAPKVEPAPRPAFLPRETD